MTQCVQENRSNARVDMFCVKNLIWKWKSLVIFIPLMGFLQYHSVIGQRILIYTVHDSALFGNLDFRLIYMCTLATNWAVNHRAMRHGFFVLVIHFIAGVTTFFLQWKVEKRCCSLPTMFRTRITCDCATIHSLLLLYMYTSFFFFSGSQ